MYIFSSNAISYHQIYFFDSYIQLHAYVETITVHRIDSQRRQSRYQQSPNNNELLLTMCKHV